MQASFPLHFTSVPYLGALNTCSLSGPAACLCTLLHWPVTGTLGSLPIPGDRQQGIHRGDTAQSSAGRAPGPEPLSLAQQREEQPPTPTPSTPFYKSGGWMWSGGSLDSFSYNPSQPYSVAQRCSVHRSTWTRSQRPWPRASWKPAQGNRLVSGKSTRSGARS